MFVASADVAQSVEHLIGNEEVGSSNLLISSKRRCTAYMRCIFFSEPYGKTELIIFRSNQSVMRGAEPSAACGGESEAKAQ